MKFWEVFWGGSSLGFYDAETASKARYQAWKDIRYSDISYTDYPRLIDLRVRRYGKV